MKLENKGIFDSLELAKYLNYLHITKYKEDISPLKLQKTMFFLFGEWGAFVNASSDNNDGKNLKEYSNYLFNDEFEAWIYGPAIVNVYKNFNNEQIKENDIFTNTKLQYVGKFIQDLAEELFEVSDFRLVELTHQMECWKKNYNESDEFHNKTINKDDIIEEFSR